MGKNKGDRAKASGAKAAKLKAAKPKEPKVPKPGAVSKEEIEVLRKLVEEAQRKLEQAKKEAQTINGRAREMITEARSSYLKVLSPFRALCKRARIACPFQGGRASNVSEMVRFEVKKVPQGIRVMVVGQPKSEEVIPLSAIKESSVSAAAYAYTERHVGPRERVGNKGGSLSNRLRAVIATQ